MLKKQALADTVNKRYYGFGVSMNQTDLGYVISHSGGWPGYITFLARNVDKDQTFIVLSNNESASPSIAMALHQILNSKLVIMPYQHKEIPVDFESLPQFVGTYKAADEITIEYTGNKLFRINASGRKFELKPESATTFFYADGTDHQIEFEMDTNNKVVKAWLIDFGVKTAYAKK